MNENLKRLYEYCKSHGYDESEKTFEQDLKDLAVEELEGQELSKVSGGKKAFTALTAGMISALSVASPLASANQVCYFNSRSPYSYTVSKKSDSSSMKKLKNILIKSGITLASIGTIGVIGGGIALIASNASDSKENSKPADDKIPTTMDEIDAAERRSEEDWKFWSNIFDQSINNLQNYYGSLDDEGKKEIINFIHDHKEDLEICQNEDGTIRLSDRNLLSKLDSFLYYKLDGTLLARDDFYELYCDLDWFQSGLPNQEIVDRCPVTIPQAGGKSIKHMPVEIVVGLISNVSSSRGGIFNQPGIRERIKNISDLMREDYKKYYPEEPLLNIRPRAEKSANLQSTSQALTQKSENLGQPLPDITQASVDVENPVAQTPDVKKPNPQRAGKEKFKLQRLEFKKDLFIQTSNVEG